MILELGKPRHPSRDCITNACKRARGQHCKHFPRETFARLKLSIRSYAAPHREDPYLHWNLRKQPAQPFIRLHKHLRLRAEVARFLLRENHRQ